MERSFVNKKRRSAKLCSCVDESNTTLHMEFTIPGVKKEDISLKLNEDRFSLKADKYDTEYISTGSFCCPVVVGSAEARYENGLLLINIPLKDRWENVKAVTIH